MYKRRARVTQICDQERVLLTETERERLFVLVTTDAVVLLVDLSISGRAQAHTNFRATAKINLPIKKCFRIVLLLHLKLKKVK